MSGRTFVGRPTRSAGFGPCMELFPVQKIPKRRGRGRYIRGCACGITFSWSTSIWRLLGLLDRRRFSALSAGMGISSAVHNRGLLDFRWIRKELESRLLLSGTLGKASGARIHIFSHQWQHLEDCRWHYLRGMRESCVVAIVEGV